MAGRGKAPPPELETELMELDAAHLEEILGSSQSIPVGASRTLPKARAPIPDTVTEHGHRAPPAASRPDGAAADWTEEPDDRSSEDPAERTFEQLPQIPSGRRAVSAEAARVRTDPSESPFDRLADDPDAQVFERLGRPVPLDDERTFEQFPRIEPTAVPAVETVPQAPAVELAPITGLQGGQRFGPYRLLVCSASRRDTEEWIAADDRGATPRPVVLRRLDGGIDGPTVARFEAAARAARAVDHPSLVRVLDVGRTEGRTYLALEFVDGLDLGQLVAFSRGGLPVPVVLELAERLAGGLAAVHGAGPGSAHGAVTPAHVLVGRDGEVKLSDLATQRYTGATTAFGPLPPGPASPARDLAALAAVVVHALTARVPVLPPGRPLRHALSERFDVPGPVLDLLDALHAGGPKMPGAAAVSVAFRAARAGFTQSGPLLAYLQSSTLQRIPRFGDAAFEALVDRLRPRVLEKARPRSQGAPESPPQARGARPTPPPPRRTPPPAPPGGRRTPPPPPAQTAQALLGRAGAATDAEGHVGVPLTTMSVLLADIVDESAVYDLVPVEPEDGAVATRPEDPAEARALALRDPSVRSEWEGGARFGPPVRHETFLRDVQEAIHGLFDD
jgi:energy-converting hydrogenase Eha subunit A